MPDTGPTAFDRATALRTAQRLAYESAQAAHEHHVQAVARSDYANARASSDYLRQAVAESRQLAQHHAVRATEAARLADVWAHVAIALAAGPDTRPATYDLNIQLDPKGVGEELVRQARIAQRREGA